MKQRVSILGVNAIVGGVSSSRNDMLRLRRLAVLVLVIGLLGLLPLQQAQAFNFRFLKNSAVARFTDADWQMLREATRQALDHGSDGDTVTWRNEQSGHWGSVTPYPASDRQGVSCRQARFVTHAAQRTGDTSVMFCQRDGQWKVVQ